MTTPALIMSSARAYIATLAPSRDASRLFLEHTTNTPFEDSPVAGADGFEVVEDRPILTQGFGTGAKEGQFHMVVKVGHSPFTTDKLRERDVANDIERLADLLEFHTWPTGTMAVFFEEAATDKQRANWWISTLKFRVLYTGAVRSL